MDIPIQIHNKIKLYLCVYVRMEAVETLRRQKRAGPMEPIKAETAYLMMGHGEEIVGPPKIVPEGCTLVVQVHSGQLNYFNSRHFLNFFEYKEKEKFLDPVTYYPEIVKQITKGNPDPTSRTLAIYKEGDTYPDFRYTLVSYFQFGNQNKEPWAHSLIRPSGIAKYPFETDENDGNFFVGQQILRKNRIIDYDFNSAGDDIYTKYFKKSIFPTKEFIREKLNDKTLFPDGNDTTIKQIVDSPIGFNGEETTILQSELFEKFKESPGVYYNTVCRARKNVKYNRGQLNENELQFKNVWPKPKNQPMISFNEFKKIKKMPLNIFKFKKTKKAAVGAIIEAVGHRAPFIESLELNKARVTNRNIDEILFIKNSTLEKKTHIVELLFKNDKENPVFENLLISAIEKGYPDIARLLIKGGVNVKNLKTRGPDRASALIIAIAKKYLDIAELLIEKGADVNARTTNGSSALILASEYGYLKIAKLLIEKGADINAVSSGYYRNGVVVNGGTALTIAINKDYLKIAELLIENGANVNAANTTNGLSALMLASQKGTLEIAKLLIEKDADVNAVKKSTGETALTIAIDMGHLNIAELLIEKGADVNAVKKSTGETALILASQKGYLGIAELLIEKGANVNAATTGYHGGTALTIAINKDHLKIAELLIEKGADVNAVKKSTGETALILAIQKGYLGIAELLIQKNADVNVADTDEGYTALILASQKGHLEIVKLLIEKGAKVNATKKSGITALMLASREGHLEIVKLLIEKGAKVGAKTRSNMTALNFSKNSKNDRISKIITNTLKANFNENQAGGSKLKTRRSNPKKRSRKLYSY